MSADYVRWDDPKVEPAISNEPELINEIISLINKVQQHNFSMHRHMFRGTHVKTQAIVKGTLTIAPNLAPELAHGIASASNASAPHPVAIRFANEPSWLQDDRTKGPRGCGMKIFNVHSDKGAQGFMTEQGATTRTQDMTFNNAPILELRDLPTTVDIFKIRESHFRNPDAMMPELEKRDDTELQKAPFQLPNSHFLGYDMYSQSAYRWGPYIAKYALFPTGRFQTALSEMIVDDNSDPEQHSIWLAEYFKSHDATYDLRVQLCQDLEKQPVENTSAQWDEEKFPFQTVGQVVLPKGQDPMDGQRRAAWDDGMSLNVWYGLDEHRPLGSANRLRKELYRASLAKRELGNGRKVNYISSVDELP